MKTYKELETLGFFDWFGDEHYSSVEDVDDLDNLTIDDIRLTTLNAAIFRWFREKYSWYNVPLGTVRLSDNKVVYHIGNPNIIYPYSKLYDTYGEAEQECLKQLIKIVKDGKVN